VAAVTIEIEDRSRALLQLRVRLRRLYHGRTPEAVRFQYAVIAIDLAIIAFFIATPVLQDEPSFLWFDYSIAALLGFDLVARALASRDITRWLKQPRIWVDFFILLTLLLPAALVNLGFLRILRLWSMSRSGFLWRPLQYFGLGPWRETGHALVNLITFLFVVAGFLYTFFFRKGEGFADYIDALYFTVAAATTTGFGDIVLPGPWGKLTSIVVMISGIGLLVRLAQSIFRPPKVFFPCPQCALQRHDPDAVHCKACGYLLRIPDEGGGGT
jgi:voltage-gated potassium channel